MSGFLLNYKVNVKHNFFLVLLTKLHNLVMVFLSESDLIQVLTLSNIYLIKHAMQNIYEVVWFA